MVATSGVHYQRSCPVLLDPGRLATVVTGAGYRIGRCDQSRRECDGAAFAHAPESRQGGVASESSSLAAAIGITHQMKGSRHGIATMYPAAAVTLAAISSGRVIFTTLTRQPARVLCRCMRP